MVNMQTLTFNSTEKTVVLQEGARGSKDFGGILETFNNVPTVKVENGYYEVMQIQGEQKVPVLRVPMANTNMLIQK
jgi:hypothetical protein